MSFSCRSEVPGDGTRVNEAQRKALREELKRKIGKMFEREAPDVRDVYESINYDALHAYLLLEIFEQLEIIDDRLFRGIEDK